MSQHKICTICPIPETAQLVALRMQLALVQTKVRVKCPGTRSRAKSSAWQIWHVTTVTFA